MSPRLNGTVTFPFPEVAGSTALWERDRDAMQAALSLHDRLLRAAIESRNGHVIKTVCVGRGPAGACRRRLG